MRAIRHEYPSMTRRVSPLCPSGEALVATTNRSPLRPLAMNVFAPDFHAHLARQARGTDRLSAPLCPPRRPESLPASKHGERRAAASSAVHGGRLWRPGEPPRGHSAAKLYGLRARLTSRCGMITDRDIVITCIAAGDDPSTTAVGELARGSVYNVDATPPSPTCSRSWSHTRCAACPSLTDTGWSALSMRLTSPGTCPRMQSPIS